MSRGYHLWTETITDNLRSFVYQTWHTIQKNGPANFEWCSESNSYHLTRLSTELTFLQLWKLYVHIHVQTMWIYTTTVKPWNLKTLLSQIPRICQIDLKVQTTVSLCITCITKISQNLQVLVSQSFLDRSDRVWNNKVWLCINCTFRNSDTFS